MEKRYQLKEIGQVKVTDHGFQLMISEAYRSALKELRHFSHLHVIWWFDQHDNETSRSNYQTELPYAPGTVAGVFATRSDERPNPLAITVCSLIDVDEAQGVITIAWIDALDGSPIVDLKPYLPVNDRVRTVEVAPWFKNFPAYLEDAADFDWASVGLS